MVLGRPRSGACWGVQNYRNLDVSEHAHRLAIATYRHTAPFPAAERFGITSQMRRGSVSIASCIAEGCGRRTNRELVHYLYMSLAATNELVCQLRIATDLGFGDPSSAARLHDGATRVAKMLNSLIAYHRRRADRKRNEDRQ